MKEQKKWDFRMAAAARAGLGVEAVDIVLLPAYSQKTIASGKKRRHLLRNYLREQLEAVAELPRKDRKQSSEASPSASSRPFDLERFCARCRGYCCRTGGNHGFISPRTLARVLGADPSLDGDALIDLYLRHVPARSYAGSCIYHGASGCALPRALRSEVCTSFFCKGLESLSESIARHPQRAVVGAFELKDRVPRPIARAMIVHDGRVEELRPSGPAAPARSDRQRQRPLVK